MNPTFSAAAAADHNAGGGGVVGTTNAAGSPTSKIEKEKPFWLTSYKDHLAGLDAYTACVETADLNGNGDHQLVIADASKKLKLYSGTQMTSEISLLDAPVGVVAFYSEYTAEVRRPLIAVASGPFLFIYKNLRPYYKFVLPPMELHPSEIKLWHQIKSGELTADDALAELEILRDHGTFLSNRSMDLLNMDNATERQNFINNNLHQPLVQHTVITCLTTVAKENGDIPAGEGGICCLVIGTEDSRVIVLEKSGDAIKSKIGLPSPPVEIICSGALDIEYRLIVMCRNGSIYISKDGALTGVVIEVEAQPVAMIRVENSLVVGTTTQQLHFYKLKGTKQVSLPMPAAITNLAAIVPPNTTKAKSFVLALNNGEIRTYVGRSCINKMQTFGVVSALKVCKYGREDNSLVLVLTSGSLLVAMLPRKAKLEATKDTQQGPPEEQDVPLNVPKRTNLYMELTEREKESPVDMHRIFQRDLSRLRLQTARAYVKILGDGLGSQSHTTTYNVRLTADVIGLGPHFKLKLHIQNTGNRALIDIRLVFMYPQELYKMQSPHLRVASLVPSVVYNYQVPLVCIQEEGAPASEVRVLLCDNNNVNATVPIIAATIKIPAITSDMMNMV